MLFSFSSYPSLTIVPLPALILTNLVEACTSGNRLVSSSASPHSPQLSVLEAASLLHQEMLLGAAAASFSKNRSAVIVSALSVVAAVKALEDSFLLLLLQNAS